MKNINNIILDLGGVLFDLNYHKTQNEFEKLGLSNAFSKANQIDLFDQFEEGQISPEQFFNGINKIAGKLHDHQIIEDAWNIMLLGFPQKRIDLLTHLAKNYRLFLYSNTNETHIHEVFKIMENQINVSSLDPYFEKVYLSNELGIRKPKPEGFLHIVEQNNLVKHETLFIDDSPQHVEGAKQAGIHAEWLDLDREDIHDMLLRLQIIS